MEHRLAPIVKLDLPEARPQFCEQSPIEVERQHLARAAVVTGTSEAVGAPQIACARRFNAEPRWIAPQDVGEPVPLPGEEVLVEDAAPGGHRPLVFRRR